MRRLQNSSNSKRVLECQLALKTLTRRNKVRLTCVPGHSGVIGNEKAL